MSCFSFLRGKRKASPKHTQSTNQSITEPEIYRYRKQRGVNLGSWFVLERWICDEPFKSACSPGQSDLDVARGKNAKETLERHWDTWITDQDWDWISRRGLNAVRIPIGYYHICGAEATVLLGTDFQDHHNVYSGAWSRITQAIGRASEYKIGVLIDLHAAPGKQNHDSHSGTSNPPHFFDNSHHQKHTIDVLCALVTHLNRYVQSFDPPLANIIGVELLNEPAPPSDHALQQWYTSAISKIRKIDASLPIYLGECWRTDAYAEYVAQNPSPALTVLDHHLYRCFISEDIRTSAEDHARAISDPSAWVSKMLTSASERVGRAGGGVVVGEWSGALNPGSLRGVRDEQKNYISSQLAMFERSCSGWFFWTYKKQAKGDIGWSIRDAVEKGVFPDFVGLLPRPCRHDEMKTRRDDARDLARTHAFDAHVQHWSQYPGSYDHSLFRSGFTLGWEDAYQFMLSSPPSGKAVNQLGFTVAWALRRATTPVSDKNYWEFEHGFIQGISAATSDYERK